MTNRTLSTALFVPTLALLNVAAPAQTLWPGAGDATGELAELQAALREAAVDPEATASLLRYIERYPASTHRAEALLALEQAQILSQGRYTLPAGTAEPALTQLRPSAEHLQWFCAGQNTLADSNAAATDIDTARRRYEQLRTMDDPAYRTEADYYIGYIAYREGRLDEALSRFDALPDDQEKYARTVPIYRAQVLLAMGRWDDAREAAVLQRGRTDLTAAQRLELDRIEGECLLQRGDAEGAYPHLMAYVEGAEAAGLPIVGGSAYNAALLAYRRGDQALTQRALARVIGQQDAAPEPASVPATHAASLLGQHAYMLLGQSCLLTGDYDQARMAFDQAAAPGSPDPDIEEAAAYNLATLIHQERHALPFGEEVTHLEAFLNRFPTSPYADRVSEYLTDSYMTSRNYERALASIDRIKQPSQRLLTARQRLLFQLGTQQYVNGLHSEAERTLGECIRLGDLNPALRAEAYYWRGEARYHQGNDRTAEADFRTAAQAAAMPTALRPLANYSLGYARFRQGDFDGAQAAFAAYTAQPAQRGADTYADALTRLGDCLYYQRRFAEAEAQYRQAREAAPRAATADYALFQEAFMMGLQKKYDAKVSTLATLLRTYPQSERCAQAWLETGRTYLLQGRNDQALDAFRQAMEAYPTSPVAPQAAVQRAMTFNLMGRPDQAREAYQYVVSRWPNTDEARTALEDLRALYLDRGDVAGYDRYLASLTGGMGLTAAERDSLSLLTARRFMGEGRRDEAYRTLADLIATTGDAALLREQLPVLQELAAERGDHAQVISAYTRMTQVGGYEAHRMQQAQLLAARAHFALRQPDQAMPLLEQAAADVRTAPGAQAAYLRAQTLSDTGHAAEAKALAEALIQQGTPHAYWLARTILLYADLLADEGDAFRATQYLKSLQKNYTPAGPDDDVHALIDQRLKNLQTLQQQ